MSVPRAGRRRDRARRRRAAWWLRARALLAGGLVLGIGAAATLAAWNDNEFSTAAVASGRFGIVGSMNGGAFADHASSPGATLTFTPTLGAVYPGAPAGFTTVQIRTASTATGGFDSVSGTLRLQTATAAVGALASALVYAIRIVPEGAGCNETLFSDAAAPVIVANDTALTTGVGVSAANTQALQAAGANTVAYCIRVALPATAPDATQNLTATVTWQFAGSTS